MTRRRERAAGRSRETSSREPGGAAVYTVSELTREIRNSLEARFGRVAVQGEITNLSRPQSGHVYFSLVDDEAGSASRFANAQLPVVMWRSRASRLRFRLDGGQKVIACGQLSVYEPRGTYQLIADRLVPEGTGELQLAFEQLREKLKKEGLFDPARKRPLPFAPRRIGLITSPTGAAIRDFLRLVYQRFPGAWVRLVPVPVQGEGAAGEIARALGRLRESDVDVVVLARGGGSLEDLWAFNEEVVARALAGARVPTVSAVGHEVDFTIADFVADARAPTPSAAAALVAPDQAELHRQLDGFRRRARLGLRATLERSFRRLERAAAAGPLKSPQMIVQKRFEYVDEASSALQNSLYNRLREWNDKLLLLAARLEGLSPFSVLARGYSVATTPDGELIRKASQLKESDPLIVRFAEGQVRAVVQSVDRVGARKKRGARSPQVRGAERDVQP